MNKIISTISKVLKKKLESNYYDQVREIYHFFKYFKARNYNSLKDLKHNENLLKSFGFSTEKIKSQLNSLNYLYQSDKLSWHYHVFVGLKEYFKDKKINILEIGTFDGEFTNFISRLFHNSEITTIDLEESDENFINSYERNEEKKMREFLEKREKNINRENINFIKLNSINIKEYFLDKKFDLIWVDGDHLMPQIIFDIINSLYLLNNEGILCTDDVIMDLNFKKNNYVSNEGWLTLDHLKKNNILKNYYFVKRITKTNYYNKKYISLSTFVKNNNFTQFEETINRPPLI